MAQKVYLKLYSPQDTYISPAGTIMDATAVEKEFPATKIYPYVVGTDAAGQMMHSLSSLGTLKAQYGIEGGVSNEEAVALIAGKMYESALAAEQQAEEAAQIPDATERIAAALEYQVLCSMMDEEVEA